MGFPTQEYWNGMPFPSPEDLPDTGIKPASPALQADSLPSEPPWKPLVKKRKRRSKGNIRNPLVSCPHSVLDLHIDASLKSSDRRLITSRDNPFKFLW